MSRGKYADLRNIFDILEVWTVRDEELMNVLQKKRSQYKKSLVHCYEMPTWSRCSSGQESAMMKPKAQAKAPGPGGSTYRAEGTGDEK